MAARPTAMVQRKVSWKQTAQASILLKNHKGAIRPGGVQGILAYTEYNLRPYLSRIIRKNAWRVRGQLCATRFV